MPRARCVGFGQEEHTRYQVYSDEILYGLYSFHSPRLVVILKMIRFRWLLASAALITLLFTFLGRHVPLASRMVGVDQEFDDAIHPGDSSKKYDEHKKGSLEQDMKSNDYKKGHDDQVMSWGDRRKVLESEGKDTNLLQLEDASNSGGGSAYFEGTDHVSEIESFWVKSWVQDMKEHLMKQDEADIEPLKELCSETDWVPGRVFQCDDNTGGIGNIFVQILECVRFAILGGASLVIPKIHYRGEDLSELTQHGSGSLGYLFDQDSFISAMKEACPKMKLYDEQEDIPKIKKNQKPIDVVPRELITHNTYSQWRARLDDKIRAHPSKQSKHPRHGEEVTLVNITPNKERLIFTYYLAEDTPDLQRTFRTILKFKENVYELSAWVLYGLSTTFDPAIQPIDATQQSSLQTLQSLSIVGVHLRTEFDARIIAWPNYEAQTNDYFNKIDLFKRERTGHPGMPEIDTIYLGAGDQEYRELFSHHAWVRSQYRVTDKSTILEALSTSSRNLTAQFEKLTWDQQALIDLVVLTHGCALFMGMVHSSFAWTVALRRHLTLGTSYAQDLEQYLTKPEATLSDGINFIPGAPGEAPWFKRSLWP